MSVSTGVTETVKRFYDVAYKELSKAIQEDRHKKAYYYNHQEDSKEHLDYSDELNILKSNFKPLIWGVGTAFVVFSTFRISKYTGKLVKTHPNDSSSPSSSSFFFRYRFENSSRYSRSTKEQLSDLASVPLDLLLSFFIGTSTAIFLTDEEKVMQDIGTIPLVKGKSLISETLCTPFLKEYQKVDPALWKSKEGRNSSSLQTIQTFCRNCQKRQDGNFASNSHADG